MNRRDLNKFVDWSKMMDELKDEEFSFFVDETTDLESK